MHAHVMQAACDRRSLVDDTTGFARIDSYTDKSLSLAARENYSTIRTPYTAPRSLDATPDDDNNVHVVFRYILSRRFQSDPIDGATCDHDGAPLVGGARDNILQDSFQTSLGGPHRLIILVLYADARLWCLSVISARTREPGGTTLHCVFHG